jgi:hypothetical protein
LHGFFLRQTQTVDSSCWQQHLLLTEFSVSVEEIRLRLHREGLLSETIGRAMFDDLFFFEIPTLQLSGQSAFEQ